MQKLTINNLGFPRIGANRELKKATEAFWKGEMSLKDLESEGKKIRLGNWQLQKNLGADLIPCNDFSFYDQVLDTSCLVGSLPQRFKKGDTPIDLVTMFTMARGKRPAGQDKHPVQEALACEMTKWFDTNYHYIVPEFTVDTNFKISTDKIFKEFSEAKNLGINAKPVLLSPFSYLYLGKGPAGQAHFNRLALLDKLLPVYTEILTRLHDLGASWVQIDEPTLVLDLSKDELALIAKTYKTLAEGAPQLKIMLATYFGGLHGNWDTVKTLPVHALHLDAIRGGTDVINCVKDFPKDKILSLGILDGRNIWRSDYKKCLSLVDEAQKTVGHERLMIAPSCSLLHTPVSLQQETGLDPEVKSWLAFSEEKLQELYELREIAANRNHPAFKSNQTIIEARRLSPRTTIAAVQARCEGLDAASFKRKSPFDARQGLQKKALELPLFPTTSIGSLPQTKVVRQKRAQFRQGKLSATEYDNFLKEEIKHAMAFQDRIDIDMPVHGEFERNDMVEYFGEYIDGYLFTKNGWVQSYGSRYVKPPVIYGDLKRREPMTVKWTKYAQSLTKKPVKGMLTGPVTMVHWSFVRDDQSKAETAKQMAPVIRDEVADLEAAGIKAIQIDEPAFREGLPLRRADWQAYLDWAVETFRLSAAVVKDETQIHTHMCYSEFNDIIKAIAALDADVISIESSRSKMELLKAFEDFRYPNEIGPGIYDIHSPLVPDTKEMVSLLEKALKVIPSKNLWVNPDCGLKTRDWEEVEESLKHLVASAKKLRELHAN